MNTSEKNKTIYVEELSPRIHDALVDKLCPLIPMLIGKIIQRETIKKYHLVD